MSDQESAVMTVSELVKTLSIGRRAVYEAIARGDVPGVIRLGKSIRISRAAVTHWLEGEPKGEG